MIKKSLTTATFCFLISIQANAISVSSQVGKNYTQVSTSLGSQNIGFGLNGQWIRSEHKGKLSSIGATFGLPLLGIASVHVGAKAMYLSPKNDKDGLAFATGGGINLSLFSPLSLYGEVYTAPSSFTAESHSVTEATAGVRYTFMRLVTIDAGYRVIDIKGKSNRPNNKIADGVFFSIGTRF